MSDKLFNKLICPICGGYYKAKFTNIELQKRYPYSPNVLSLKNRRNKNKFINARRNVICSNCGHEEKISKKLLMKISALKARRDRK